MGIDDQMKQAAEAAKKLGKQPGPMGLHSEQQLPTPPVPETARPNTGRPTGGTSQAQYLDVND